MTEHIFTLAQMRQAIKDVEAGGHSVFAPSSSKMWLGCAGSLIPNIFAPDDAGEDAAYGTVGHMVGETWLKSGKKPSHLLGTKHWVESGEWGYLIEIDETMMEYVRQYVNWCKPLPGTHFVEVRVDFSQLTPIPKQGGTSDHVACTYRRMVITDLKMGKGVKVYAENNTQGRLYALGFFFEWDWLYDFQEIVIRIAQPRLEHWDEWTITREELLEFAEEVRVKAAAAWVQNAPRTPSPEACQWCKVQATCTAKAIVIAEMTEGIFTDTTQEVPAKKMKAFKEDLDAEIMPRPIDPSSLTTHQLEILYKWRSSAEQYFKKVGELLEQRNRNGAKLDLHKSVESYSHRAWRNRDKAVKALIKLGLKREDILVEEMQSPAKVEDLLVKAGVRRKDLENLLDDLIFRPPGKAVLVPLSDKRRPIGDISEGVFGDTTL